MLSTIKPNSVLVKSQDFNQRVASDNQNKKHSEVFRKLDNIYFPNINKSPFLI